MPTFAPPSVPNFNKTRKKSLSSRRRFAPASCPVDKVSLQVPLLKYLTLQQHQSLLLDWMEVDTSSEWLTCVR
ncbi:MAG: hypothetical protein U0003_01625 [Vampirovibrionales bacterium]